MRLPAAASQARQQRASRRQFAATWRRSGRARSRADVRPGVSPYVPAAADRHAIRAADPRRHHGRAGAGWPGCRSGRARLCGRDNRRPVSSAAGLHRRPWRPGEKIRASRNEKSLMRSAERETVEGGLARASVQYLPLPESIHFFRSTGSSENIGRSDARSPIVNRCLILFFRRFAEANFLTFSVFYA